MNALPSGFDLFGLTQPQFETFLLVVVRTTVMLSFVPIFSSSQIPLLMRVGLGLLLSFVTMSTTATLHQTLGLAELTVAIVAQVAIGFIFGFVAFLVFTGVQYAGEIIDIQIGFAVVNIVNPATSQSVTVIGELELALATLLYLAADAHHQLLAGISGSFTLVPLPYVTLSNQVETDVVKFFSEALFLVLQIAGPVAISLFIVNIGLALMARVAPQMNIFAVGFPLQILVGFVMLIISMPLLGVVLPEVFARTPHELDTVLRAMHEPTP